MQRAANFLKYLIYSTSLFAIISSLISSSVWLDMRVHSKHVAYVIFLIMAVVFILNRFQKLREIKFLVGMDILFLFVIFLGKLNRISYELRDAFNLKFNIVYFKALLILIFTIGNILIFYSHYKSKGVD